MLSRKGINANRAFTLVELAIVLIIIGLITGGVLVGQTLIEQAEITSFKKQLDDYDRAVNTFQLKYHYLPGDIKPGPAAKAGLTPRSGAQHQGDGNGQIRGDAYSLYTEAALFWRDLSDAGFIEEKFAGVIDGSVERLETNDLDAYLPRTRLPQIGNPYINVGYISTLASNIYAPINATGTNSTGFMQNYTAFTTKTAYMLDQKFDDGLPDSGNIRIVSCTTIAGTPRTYNLNSTTNNCILLFKANMIQ